MRRLIEHATIWNGADRVILDGAVVVDDDTISAVLDGSTEDADVAGAERFDAGGRLLIPGLINAHTHLYSSLARGMSVPGFAPSGFTAILEQLWWRLDKALDPESVRMSATIGAMEAARCGITTLIDHHASPHAIHGSLTALRDAVCRDVGLRGAFCYEVSDRDGPRSRDEGISENVAFLAEAPPENRTNAAQFGLHASFTLSDETLERVAEHLPSGTGVHIHVAEGPEDETGCVTEHGVRVVKRLQQFGFLRRSSLFAHCLHIDDEEKDLLAEHDVMVVHNPRSNMNNAVGAFALDDLRRRKLLMGLGTDGLGANMLGELFTAGLLQRHERRDPLAGGLEALHALQFSGNAAIVERLFGVDVGRIAPGYAADLTLLDYRPPTPFRAENALGHFLFGLAVHATRVTDLWVAGAPVLADGRFVDLDEDGIYEKSREIALRLWERVT